jgi:type IX secretion system PorP/SprF family membrane protein
MKKYIIFIIMLMPSVLRAQQLPLTESYLLDPFVLSSAYAGVHNTRTLMVNYRSDWSGISGGPKTFRLSYHQALPVLKNVSVGAKMISDQTDIFRQNYLLTSYAYTIKVASDQTVNFGLSFGIYRNSIDLGKYYNSSSYQDDPVLTTGLEKSKLKFMSDYAVLYRWRELEAGLVFTNVTFGNSYYQDATEISNKPLSNCLIHASYLYRLNDNWSFKPFLLFRDGKYSPSQLELAVQTLYRNKYWASLLYRGKGIWSMGIGGEILDGVMLNYSYNAGYDITISAFQNHEITLGINLDKILQTIDK